MTQIPADCVLFIAASMYPLSLAMRTVPAGTANAVWVGTAIHGMAALGEDRPPPRVLGFVLILAGIAGLKGLSGKSPV